MSLTPFLSAEVRASERTFHLISSATGKSVMETNLGKAAKVNGEDFVACVVKEKKVPFADNHFVALNLERVRETQRR